MDGILGVFAFMNVTKGKWKMECMLSVLKIVLSFLRSLPNIVKQLAHRR